MSCNLFGGPVLANTERATHRKRPKKQSQIHTISVGSPGAWPGLCGTAE
jgi:hypothetical protein